MIVSIVQNDFCRKNWRLQVLRSINSPLKTSQNIMSKQTESAASVNLFPVIALLILNLLAVLVTLGIVLARTADNGGNGLVASSTSKAVAIDRIGDIRLVDNNVVFDLIDLDENAANPEVSKQVTISQEGFVRGYAGMEKFMNQLIELGLVTANDAEPAAGE